jgi:hypothetical protein
MTRTSTVVPTYDKLGRQIKQDSYIVYASTYCDSSALKIGKVIKVLVKERLDINGQIIFTEYCITVIGVDEHSSFGLRLSRKGTLQFPDRIIVIDEVQVPEEYLKLLRDIK